MIVSAWVPLTPDLTLTEASVRSRRLAELLLIFTVTLMPLCPGWVPAAVDDGVNLTTLTTVADILSVHWALWLAPNGIVPFVDRLPPPPPVSVATGPGTGVRLADGLEWLSATTDTAMPPPQITSTMTTIRVTISAVLRCGGACGGG